MEHHLLQCQKSGLLLNQFRWCRIFKGQQYLEEHFLTFSFKLTWYGHEHIWDNFQRFLMFLFIFKDIHVLCKLFSKKCRSSPLKCPWLVYLRACTWAVTASAKVQQHFVGICFRTTERMLITFGPLYKPASRVVEEYIPAFQRLQHGKLLFIQWKDQADVVLKWACAYSEHRGIGKLL